VLPSITGFVIVSVAMKPPEKVPNLHANNRNADGQGEGRAKRQFW
jgi:hypothetical protein